ncbi:MAG: endolytic transglycosylase MltG [Gaiellaceae bacterium]
MSGTSTWSTAVALACAVACAGATAVQAAPPPAKVSLGIIFPEGYTVRDMTARVAAVRRIAIRKRHVKPVLTAHAYAKAAARVPAPRAFRHSMTRPSIEGFLFPSRYDFGPVTTAAELIALQLAEFSREWGKVTLRAARARGLDPYGVLIVASMIERETVVPAERALVAAVVYNRLDADMPLGIDATLRYGLRVPATRPLTKANLASRSPYNTRRFKGLPPTPIGNPGLASIQAAAHPANVDYLYYVRKPDKLHHFFTADADEFCRKAREYGYGC